MNFFQVLILSVVHGAAEFLPISSSGHLVILQKLFGLKEPPVLFDVLLHVGSVGAIMVYFRKEFLEILNKVLKKDSQALKLVVLVVLGTFPAAIIGALLDKQVEEAFNSLRTVGLGLIFTSLLLFSTRVVHSSRRQFNHLNWFDALFIGFFQAVAILPGISRSGSTIVSGIWRGLSRETTFAFSFYLAIPAILGALVFKIKDLSGYSGVEISYGFIGMIISAVIGYFSLKVLAQILKSAKFIWFGVYCLMLGLLILLA